MSLYRIESVQEVPANLDEVWGFFSSPDNLSYLTPSGLDFSITTPEAGSMYPGQLIVYRFRPFFWMKMQWVAEITQVEDRSYFIDEQRMGPFRFWRHEHHFSPTSGGVMIKDILYYRMPFGILGRMAHFLLIGRNMDRVFRYRQERLRQLFGS